MTFFISVIYAFNFFSLSVKPRNSILFIQLLQFQDLENTSFSNCFNFLQAEGKIVIFNQKWTSYGETVQYRSRGASEAARVGALACLIRSVTPFSIYSPHTGHQVSNTVIKCSYKRQS